MRTVASARARAESERKKERGEPARRRVKKCEAARAAALSLPSSSGSAVRWGALGTTRGPPRVRERTMAEQRQTASSQSAAEPARRTVGTRAFTRARPSVRPSVRTFVRFAHCTPSFAVSSSSDCRRERVRRVQVISARFSSVILPRSCLQCLPPTVQQRCSIRGESGGVNRGCYFTRRESTRSTLLDFSGSSLTLVNRPRTRSTRIFPAHGEYVTNSTECRIDRQLSRETATLARLVTHGGELKGMRVEAGLIIPAREYRYLLAKVE